MTAEKADLRYDDWYGDEAEIDVHFRLDGQAHKLGFGVGTSRAFLAKQVENNRRWALGTEARAVRCARMNLLALLKLLAVMDELGVGKAGDCRPHETGFTPSPQEIERRLIAMGAATMEAAA
jgi:hypothetical protein